METAKTGPIGVFDSGFGGLSILRDVRRVLPQYDYLFLGDNARAPYGTRSFQVVYEFTLQAVNYLFSQGCSLVILACNTASAKALRSIQQRDLPVSDDSVITIVTTSRSESYQVSLDGEGTVCPSGSTVTIERAPFKARVVQRLGAHFAHTLRQKLAWGL